MTNTDEIEDMFSSSMHVKHPRVIATFLHSVKLPNVYSLFHPMIVNILCWVWLLFEGDSYFSMDTVIVEDAFSGIVRTHK